MADRQAYLDYIQAAYDAEHGRLDAEIARWRAQFGANPKWNSLFGYSPPRFPLHLSVVAAFLAEQTGRPALARTACDTLLRYREWAGEVPTEAARQRPEYAAGVPPLDCAFDPVMYAGACERIRPVATKAEYHRLAEIAADSLVPIWHFPEWGGHNRAMLRAASLACCAHAFPAHPAAGAWTRMAGELAEESWGRWSIEDAMMYQSHWLRSLILYAEARGRSDLVDFVQPRMHMRAAVQLMTPLGMLPDFGDSHWLMHFPFEWMSCLEWGAQAYRDGAMKWAADRLWQERLAHEPPNIYAAHVLTQACRWCDDSLAATEPGPVHDALDDLVIKKVVFRTGWDSHATYALLNYRDEGDYGLVARDYLRTNLAVSAEKMHHGHADEGSFSMLVHDGTLLLHESGYRDNPPDGMYRADFYHNRLIWRPGVLLGDQTPSALRDNGHYKPVRTQRLYATHLGDAEISRIRIADEAAGVAWDRTVYFVPALPCWVVLDTALALRSAPRTFGQLWWTTDILDQGRGWADVHVSHIGAWQNAPNAALRIISPEVPGQPARWATETLMRRFQDEIALSMIWSGHHEAGRAVNFATVLWPHPYTLPAGEQRPQVEVLGSDPRGHGLAVRLVWQYEERLFTALNDLTAPWLQAELRPRYSYAQGKTVYGDLVTDAALGYARRGTDGHTWAGFINGTRLDYEGQTLYSQPANAMFQEDGSDLPGIPARFRWESE